MTASYMADLNAGLTPVQKAQDLAIRTLLEYKLYFYQVSAYNLLRMDLRWEC